MATASMSAFIDRDVYSELDPVHLRIEEGGRTNKSFDKRL
jgi:hypothetical protein